MTGTDTVGGALRAAVERVHRREWPRVELRAVSFWPRPVVTETDELSAWAAAIAAAAGLRADNLFLAAEAADLGVLR